MMKPGPKSGKATEYTEIVSAKVTPEMKRRIMLAVLRRKTADAELPSRWGTSDYVREILEAYFLEHPET